MLGGPAILGPTQGRPPVPTPGSGSGRFVYAPNDASSFTVTVNLAQTGPYAATHTAQ